VVAPKDITQTAAAPCIIGVRNLARRAASVKSVRTSLFSPIGPRALTDPKSWGGCFLCANRVLTFGFACHRRGAAAPKNAFDHARSIRDSWSSVSLRQPHYVAFEYQSINPSVHVTFLATVRTARCAPALLVKSGSCETPVWR
jgi:hypothetical protein